jgi:hypothetical protein
MDRAACWLAVASNNGEGGRLQVCQGPQRIPAGHLQSQAPAKGSVSPRTHPRRAHCGCRPEPDRTLRLSRFHHPPSTPTVHTEESFLGTFENSMRDCWLSSANLCTNSKTRSEAPKPPPFHLAPAALRALLHITDAAFSRKHAHSARPAIASAPPSESDTCRSKAGAPRFQTCSSPRFGLLSPTGLLRPRGPKSTGPSTWRPGSDRGTHHQYDPSTVPTRPLREDKQASRITVALHPRFARKACMTRFFKGTLLRVLLDGPCDAV